MSACVKAPLRDKKVGSRSASAFEELVKRVGPPNVAPGTKFN